MRLLSHILLSSLFLLLPCSAVRADDSARLAELREGYETAESPEDRIARLESIAELEKVAAPEHALVAAEHLADALWDDAFPVQVRAVELLVSTREQELIVRELARRNKKFVQQEKQMVDALMDSVKGMTLKGDLLSKKKSEPEKAKRSHEEPQKKTEAAKELGADAQELAKLRPALVAAFADIRDDRAVEALVDLLGDRFGSGADKEIAALLKHDTGPALRAVVGCLRNYEESRKDLESAHKKLERSKPRKKPSERWADEVWERSEKKRISEAITKSEERLEAGYRWAADLVAQLKSYAEEHGLKAPPKKTKSTASWKSWGIKESKKLPKSYAAASEEG